MAGIALALCACAFAQHQSLPYLRAGRDSTFTQLDFAEMYLQQQARDDVESTVIHAPEEKVKNHGSVSVFDLAAPHNAVREYQRGLAFLKEQQLKDAIHFLQKATRIYPSFVSAHNALGIAYLDQHEDDHARVEFETAAHLDDRFSLSFVNLGMMALWSNDFSKAESYLERGASLSPANATILAALAFAQNGNHQFAEALHTAEKVHLLDHRREPNVHYVAASAAQSLHDLGTMRHELTTFLAEAPANPLAPVARNYLDLLARQNNHLAIDSHPPVIDLVSSGSISEVLTFPNTRRLRAELLGVTASSDDTCGNCVASGTDEFTANGFYAPNTASTYTTWNHVFTIHQAVDETAVFFAVSRDGHAVNNLSLYDIRIRDDNKAPDRILQFTPQSELPLHLGLLIDSSGSVAHRIAFEKQAAERFMKKVLHRESDIAFVAGFNDNIITTQDFTSDPAALAKGIENLPRIGDGTSVFDAIYYACWKLAAYPDQDRVAKVLVVLTDGEDNASLRTLQQSIDEAEASGVTIYTINTSENVSYPTDANKILKMLASRTGGESVAPASLRDLDRYLARLPDVIRSRYLIAYRPANFAPNGKYRTIRVSAKENGKRLQVHARKGYYARLAEDPPAGLAHARGN